MNWNIHFFQMFTGRRGSYSRVPGRVGTLPRALVGDSWGIPQIPCLRHTFPSLSTFNAVFSFGFSHSA